MPTCAFWINYASVYLLLKGVAGTLLGLVLLPMFQDTFGVTSVEYQQYALVVMLPWSMKPLAAMIADGTGSPQALVVILAIAGAVSAFQLGHAASVNAAIAYAFVCSMQIAFTDIMAEGEYAYTLKHLGSEAEKKRTISIVWGLMFVGQLAASIVSGFVDAATCLLMACPLLLQTGIVTTANRMFIGRKRQLWPAGVVVCIALTLAAAGMVPVTLLSTMNGKIAYVLVCSLVLLVVAARMLPWPLAKANMYMFASSALYLPINGAMDYFATVSTQCIPGGPALDMQFYISSGAIVSSIAAGVAVLLFNTGTRGWSYRAMFWVGTAVRCSASLADIVFVKRWNVQAGISDKVMYLVGDAAVQTMAATLDTMPMVMLTASLCSEGSESTTYAILAAFQNFGFAVATTLGAALQTALDVHLHDGKPCTYDYLPQLILLAHTALPLLTIPLTFLLID